MQWNPYFEYFNDESAQSLYPRIIDQHLENDLMTAMKKGRNRNGERHMCPYFQIEAAFFRGFI